MALWAEVVAFSQPLTADRFQTNDVPVPLRMMDDVPVTVFDRQKRERRGVTMRSSFSHRSNPNRPDPIHARACIEKRPATKQLKQKTTHA